jgi:hypothetical protein
VPHGEDLPMLEPPKEYNLNSEMEEEYIEKTGPHEEPTNPDFQGSASESPHKLTQNELNDIAGDWELPKVKAEPLASRMKQSKYLNKGIKITLYPYHKKSGKILHHGGHSSGMQRRGWLVQSIKHEPLLR